MSAKGKSEVWGSAFNAAIELLYCGDLDAQEVYYVIRIMWVNSMVCDSQALSMALMLRQYHTDFNLVEHPKLGQFIEVLEAC